MLSLGDIAKMKIEDVALLDVVELKRLIEEAKDRAASAKMYVDCLHAAMVIKYKTEQMNSTGTRHIADNGCDVEIVIPKTVKWDSFLLKSAWDNIKNSEDYIKWSLSVDERAYTSAPASIKGLLAPARTVSAGKPVFTITNRE